MLLRKVCAEYKEVASKARLQRTALEIYSKVQDNHFKTRISQIYSCIVSTKIQLYASNPEKLTLKDIYCKQKYESLEGELGDLLEQAHKMILMIGDQQIIHVDKSGQNINEKSIIARFEDNLQQQSKDLDLQMQRDIIQIFRVRVSHLDLNIHQNIQWLGKLKSLPLSNLENTILNNIRSRNFTSLRNFLCNLSWRREPSLYLIFSNSALLNKRKCLQSILNICYKVTFRVIICFATISHSSLMKLLSACRNTKSLIFQNCKISILKVPNFGHSLDGSTIKRLELRNCRINGLIRTREPLKGFSKLVEGLSKSQDFREALKVFACAYSFNSDDEKEVSKILREHGFDQTEVLWK
ncbi:unnamed protein product [Moneuplotes crassus]|uniref:Uncharacterized protein n=1 Tax=Euplotes crassus TaxID=5936 RepID=A0AAD1UM08_EUPCR|nr:unnamed protein product [Moneuplotes crassus]